MLLYLRDTALCYTIETRYENVKYLPTIRLQPNLKPVTSLQDALSFTDIIVFAIPHEFVEDICFKINDLILAQSPIGISLCKGLYSDSNGNLERVSQRIERMIGIQMGVLSGANVAIQVAKRQHCEATVCPPLDCPSYPNQQHLQSVLRALFNTDYFKITFSNDHATVEMCGALKNIIACGAGIVDGLGFGINTKAAIIGCGFREQIAFIKHFNPKFEHNTLFESCGISDLIASSFGGRNRKVSEAFARERHNLQSLENNLLNGQKLQGPNTAKSVYKILVKHKLVEQFPFITCIYKIFYENQDPTTIINSIQA